MTVVPPGSSLELTRTAYGVQPAGVVLSRGGVKVTLTCPSVPGNSGSTGGSTTHQPPGAPTMSTVKSSTTGLSLRMVTGMLPWSPGWILSGASWSTTAGFMCAEAPSQ